MKRIFFFILFLFVTSCSMSVDKSTESPANTKDLSPTISSTAIVTPQPTPTFRPIQGNLFFDLNGSGLKDEASFIYDQTRLSDERQPLHTDLLSKIQKYLIEHPGTIDGDLITITEPGLSNYSICVKNTCSKTNEEGNFTIISSEPNAELKITDPNSGNPTLEMRFMNIWKREVIITQYSKDVTKNEMDALGKLPNCENDRFASVCKMDDESLLIRDQHLNETVTFSITEPISIEKQDNVTLGLMQGFLTSSLESDTRSWLWTFVDLNYQIGKVKNYLGESNQPDYYQKVTGTGDQHQGIDWETLVGDLILASANGQVIDVWEGSNGGAKQLRVLTQPGGINGYVFDFAHNSVNLINLNQRVYRGQIVGLTGKTGVEIPHLHLSIWQVPNIVTDNGYVYYQIFENSDYPKVMYGDGSLVPAVFDPFRSLTDENAFSLWTVDNLIIFLP